MVNKSKSLKPQKLKKLMTVFFVILIIGLLIGFGYWAYTMMNGLLTITETDTNSYSYGGNFSYPTGTDTLVNDGSANWRNSQMFWTVNHEDGPFAVHPDRPHGSFKESDNLFTNPAENDRMREPSVCPDGEYLTSLDVQEDQFNGQKSESGKFIRLRGTCSGGSYVGGGDGGDSSYIGGTRDKFGGNDDANDGNRHLDLINPSEIVLSGGGTMEAICSSIDGCYDDGPDGTDEGAESKGKIGRWDNGSDKNFLMKCPYGDNGIQKRIVGFQTANHRIIDDIRFLCR